MRGGVYFILKYWRLALCQFFLLLSHFSRAPQIPSSNLRWLLLRKRVVRKVAVLAAGLLPFLMQLKFLQVVAALPQKTSRVSSQMVALLAASLAIAKLIANVAKALA